jgi:hypothetical protein
MNIMKPLTPNMMKALCDLHRETDGMVDVAYPLKAHWKVIEGLHERKLIKRDAQIERGKVVRYVALTSLGQQYSCEHMELVINDSVLMTDRPQKCVALFFEMTKETHRAAYHRVGELKAMREFRPTMIELLNMERELDNGQIGLFMEYFPEAVQTLRDIVRLEVENDNQSHIKRWIQDSVKEAIQNAPQSHETAPKQSAGVSYNPVAPLEPLDFDFDDLSIKPSNTSSHKNAAQNFIKSMKGLTQ